MRQFTGLATITGQEPYQVTVTEDFRPWRLAATFHPCHPADVRPPVDQLSFITDPAHRGLPFRSGLFTVPEPDFATIRSQMQRGPASTGQLPGAPTAS